MYKLDIRAKTKNINIDTIIGKKIYKIDKPDKYIIDVKKLKE